VDLGKGATVPDACRRLGISQLKELMRHESIETTLRFYVGTDARAFGGGGLGGLRAGGRGGVFGRVCSQFGEQCPFRGSAAARRESP
jgi:hypothetical protein